MSKGSIIKFIWQYELYPKPPAQAIQFFSANSETGRQTQDIMWVRGPSFIGAGGSLDNIYCDLFWLPEKWPMTILELFVLVSCQIINGNCLTMNITYQIMEMNRYQTTIIRWSLLQAILFQNKIVMSKIFSIAVMLWSGQLHVCLVLSS